MKVTFLLSWRQYRKGQTIPSMPDGMANEMIRRNIVERVEEPKKVAKKSKAV